MRRRILATLLTAVALFTLCACNGINDETKLPDQETGKSTEQTMPKKKEDKTTEQTPPEKEEDKTPEEALTKEELDEIEAAYAKFYGVDFTESLTCTYYGQFGNCAVILFNGAFFPENYQTADGVYFYHPTGQLLNIYYEGELYFMDDAFRSGLLTHADIVTIRDKHKADHPNMYQLSTNLGEEITEEIAKAYLARLGNPSLEMHDVGMYSYGAFNGTYVLMIGAGVYAVNDVITSLTVDGVTFTFSTSKQFDVYHAGEFYTLIEAFGRGFLSHDDLLTVHSNYYNR